jgi:NAD(P)-dependent dehydrogenase (short-subunit alcohol dehydrogenase family)
LIASHSALGRVGESDEVAHTIASLRTADRGWINAETIEVTSGYII